MSLPLSEKQLVDSFFPPVGGDQSDDLLVRAVVTSIAPLRVKPDGNTSPLLYTPDTFVSGLSEGAYVLLGVLDGRLVVVAKLNGESPYRLSSEDLDGVVRVGSYWQPGSIDATLARHYPVAGAAGSLEVLVSDDGSRWVQRLTGHPGAGSTIAGHAWVRSGGNALAWTAWRRVTEHDSGWVTVGGLASGYVATTPVQYRRLGDLVRWRGRITHATGYASTGLKTLIASGIPAEAVPSVYTQSYCPVYISSGRATALVGNGGSTLQAIIHDAAAGAAEINLTALCYDIT